MIRILWPTIRPAVALNRAKEWRDRCADQSQVHFWFGVNVASYEDGCAVDFAFKGKAGYSVFDAGPGVTDTATQMTQELIDPFNEDHVSDKEVVVLASDDFEVPQGWDAHLVEQFKDFDGALIVNDGYKRGVNIIPLPIVSGACLRKLNGVVYNPAFHHFFSDQEMHDICQELKIVKDLRGSDAPAFSHKHWSFGGRDRDVHDMRNTEWWTEDKKTYDLRKDWPVSEKLKLPEGWK